MIDVCRGWRRAYGTRAVASAWWVFALVIASSYTANLATLLAKKSTTELIHDVEELAHSPLDIDYGAKKGGSTYTFFEVRVFMERCACSKNVSILVWRVVVINNNKIH